MKFTQRRLVVVLAVYQSCRGVQGREEEHSNGTKLETGEHDGLLCLLGDTDRVREVSTTT